MNNIKGNIYFEFSKLDTNFGIREQLNSKRCFLTELGYIQCSLTTSSSKKHLVIRILQIKNNKISQKVSDLSIGYLDVNSFTKILHIKNEMGVYIFLIKIIQV